MAPSLKKRKQRSRAEIAQAAAKAVEVDPVEDAAAKLAQHRERLRERSAINELAGERSFRALLEKLARDTVPALAPPPPYRPIKTNAKPSTETLVQMLSDFHAYETVKPSRVRDFNAYNAAIFGLRARGVVENHIAIKRKLEAGGGWRFPELVIALNGDLISGTIHELERHSDAPNVVLAVYGAAMVLAQMIRDLGANYEAVRIFCTSGNHGRLPDARRVQQKDPLRNWDAMIAILAKEATRNIPHIEWVIPDSYAVGYSIEGWRFVQMHGHEVKSWNQIPYYGLNRVVTNLNALEASRGKPIHYWLFGHFHSLSQIPAAGGETIVNGSLIGGNEFSVNGLGKADMPKQWLFGVHREHGVTHRWPVGVNSKSSYEVAPWDAL
jgi:hypothetical protein